MKSHNMNRWLDILLKVDLEIERLSSIYKKDFLLDLFNNLELMLTLRDLALSKRIVPYLEKPTPS